MLWCPAEGKLFYTPWTWMLGLQVKSSLILFEIICTVVIKFIYSEKATKFCEIFTLLLPYVVPVKSKAKILQNFVAFSEYMNFNNSTIQIQRYRQNWNSSNVRHQMMILITPIVSIVKIKWLFKPKKSQEIGIKFTSTDCSNFDKRCSGAHFVSFLFYSYCKT